MIEHFIEIGHVEIDGDRMKLIGSAPRVNGVYAWFFDGEVEYIGMTNRKYGGLDSRLRSYVRRAKHISYSYTKDGKPGTTSAMRDAIRSHIEQGGKVTVRVVTIDEMPDRDIAAFEREAIRVQRPPRNKAHIFR